MGEQMGKILSLAHQPHRLLVNYAYSYEEKELLARIAQGDEKAFHSLFSQYKHKVYHTALRLLQSTAHAEDVLQEVFMKIWLGRDRLTEINCFSAYLNTITRNHIYNALRKLANEELLLEKLLPPQPAADRQDEAIGNMSLRELQDALRKVMATLTPQQKKVFELSRMEGLKHEEIAVRLNISRETVKKHVSEALRIIRGQLQRYIQLPQFCFFLPLFLLSCV
jgi:RNA polymerase sigma-70 factor (ECF subfamily)